MLAQVNPGVRKDVTPLAHLVTLAQPLPIDELSVLLIFRLLRSMGCV